MIRRIYKANKHAVTIDLVTLFSFGLAGTQLEGLAFRTFALLYFAYFIHVVASHLLRYWDREKFEVVYSKHEAEKMTMLTFINLFSHELVDPKMTEIEKRDLLNKVESFCEVVYANQWEEL